MRWGLNLSYKGCILAYKSKKSSSKRFGSKTLTFWVCFPTFVQFESHWCGWSVAQSSDNVIITHIMSEVRWTVINYLTDLQNMMKSPHVVPFFVIFSVKILICAFHPFLCPKWPNIVDFINYFLPCARCQKDIFDYYNDNISASSSWSSQWDSMSANWQKICFLYCLYFSC